MTNRARIIYYLSPLIYALLLCLLVASNYSSPSLHGVYYEPIFNHYVNTDQYATLAEAFAHGRFDLDLPISNTLKEMENPYDYDARYEMANSGETPAYFDHAFFNGKYYSYFGALPAILLYLPYYLITGDYLPTPVAVLILGVLFCFAGAKLVDVIFSRYFKKIHNPLIPSLAFQTIMLSSGSLYLVFVSRTYSVPILASLVVTSAGLSCWLLTRKSSDGSLSQASLFAGSALMALNLGCRPQFLLSWLFAFPIFWKEITSERRLFSRKGMVPTLVAILPFVTVAIMIGIYNFSRFGSPFDLGSSYNLTGFNMTEYRQPLNCLPFLFFYYLFQPLSFNRSFPFIQQVSTSFPFDAPVPVEPMYGGLFFIVPMLFTLLLVPVVWKCIKSIGCRYMLLLPVVFTAIIIIVDGRSAGITQRYFSDFGFYLGLATSVVIGALYELKTNNAKHPVLCSNSISVVYLLLLFCCVFSIGNWLLSFFTPMHYESYVYTNPVLYLAVSTYF